MAQASDGNRPSRPRKDTSAPRAGDDPRRSGRNAPLRLDDDEGLGAEPVPGARRASMPHVVVGGAQKPTGPQRPVERPYAVGGPATRRPDPGNQTRAIKQPRVGSQPVAGAPEPAIQDWPAADPAAGAPLGLDARGPAPLHLQASNAIAPTPSESGRVPFGGALPVRHRTHMNVVTRVFQDVPPLNYEDVPPLDGEGTDEHSIELVDHDLMSHSASAPPAAKPAARAAPVPAPAPQPPRQRVPTVAPAHAAPAHPAPEHAHAAPAPVSEGAKGTVVAFFSCRGGAGTTTLAVNTAAVVAHAGISVCLVDLDLQLGEALTFLNIEPTVPLSALARDPENVDWEMLSPRLARHRSGLCGLAQTGHLEDLRELDPTRIPILLQNLRRQFAVVVVDGLRDFNDHALAALDAADRVVLVATQDVPAIRGAARRAAIFRRLGYAAEKFLLALNRFDRKSAVSPALIGEEIGLAPSFTIANDFGTVSRAINEGCPLEEIDADAAVTVEIAEMTRRIFGLSGGGGKRSFWGRLFGGKK